MEETRNNTICFKYFMLSIAIFSQNIKKINENCINDIILENSIINLNNFFCILYELILLLTFTFQMTTYTN